jgi:hypothetical protein
MAAATVASAVAVLGCSNSDSTAPGTTGTLALALTDAPFPFDSVASADLFIVRIDGRNSAADSSAADSAVNDTNSNTDPAKRWVTLATPNAAFNLLDLQGGKLANLGQITLPVGTYNGFRLILDPQQSSITLKNGTVLTGGNGIVFPSASRTGIKINLDHSVVLDATGTQMIIDFDLGHSFVMRGHSIEQNGLLFKPVIRATASVLQTGGISGTVHATTTTGDVVSGATVEILKNGTSLTDTVSANVIATTSTDDAGAYTVLYLQPGTYAVRVTPPSTSTNSAALVSDVSVTAGETTSGTDVVLP